jgi:hypothetical protein
VSLTPAFDNYVLNPKKLPVIYYLFDDRALHAHIKKLQGAIEAPRAESGANHQRYYQCILLLVAAGTHTAVLDSYSPMPTFPAVPIAKCSAMRVACRAVSPNSFDRVGRSTGRGRPWLWRIRPNQYWWDVRRAKSSAKRRAR